MIRLVDVSRYQVERADPLDLGLAQLAGYQVANIALTGGRGYVSGTWAKTYLDRAAALGMGRCTYHWLDGRTTGGQQATAQLARLRNLLGAGLAGFGHVVDVEEDGQNGITPPTWAHVADYVDALQQGLGRHIGIYGADYYWQPRKWAGGTLTPWLMGPPNDPIGVFPAVDSPGWKCGWGGWDERVILQWGVQPLPGTGNCSLSALKDHGVWADLTGGDILMPNADPGNAQPEAWAGPPAPAATIAELADTAQKIGDVRRVQQADGVADLIRWSRNRDEDLRDLLPLLPAAASAETCAPVISAELTDWIAIGGTNLGCVGDQNHGTGFHRGANYIPATDYSRKRDPNGAGGPYINWNYACAGDFRHGGDPDLRDLGRVVLAQLMDGQYPMIGEFIGQPWADRPVMYWNRWENVLREYTGEGHDVWFHLSFFRSRVDQRPYVWRNAVALTKADANAVWTTDGSVTNRPWRADYATNPTIAGATAIAAAADEAHRSAINTDTLIREQRLMQTAILTAVQGVNEEAVLAAVNQQADRLAAAIAATDVGADVAEIKALLASAGGDADLAPIVAKLDALPGRITSRIAAAQQAAADSLDQTS